MPLTDLELRAAKPRDSLFKLSDGGGLQLWVYPDGARRWRMAYRFAGAQKALAIGVYPAVGLKEAREAREQAKRSLAEGRDPSLVKKMAKAAKASASANTFDALAGELLDKKRREAKAERTLSKLEWLLGLARPMIGARPIAEITAPEILAVLRKVESRGRLETAARLRGTIGEVFRFAVATGRAEGDPTGALKGAIATPIVQHRAAIIEPKAFGGLLRAIASYEGAPETCVALELMTLTFVRPGELRSAEWAEFDLDKAVWAIPGEKMKMRRPHRVSRSRRSSTMRPAFARPAAETNSER
ncbi:tyrosine-type recombinase/integrase [Methylosinus sporium]|uniref:tyrosine-type recombinase/integrase n=1 Tax=Methylosinus sporium TaxID=428 RepID=UPI000D5A0DF0|nr:integrase arm-type DNA-binding domain-containing protein [Methylosinus sporium]PWB88530.1 integrase [Methylocystis sp. MitZ-2018]